MKVLYIETFYGGSHKTFADQWMSVSKHQFQLISMPPRFWKWRQAGSALYLAEKIPERAREAFDVMVVSGMTDLAHLKALRPDLPPVILYLHENQFAYPVKDGEPRDFRYGITDLVNILCAEVAVFNSNFNRNVFLNECENLFRRLPDAVPGSAVAQARKKSLVAYPGINLEEIDAAVDAVESADRITGKVDNIEPGETPLIIWNHRHEYDKNPEETFRILENLRNRGVHFNLAILGERYKKAPEAFSRARRELADRIICDEFPARKTYLQWLSRGDFVVSTANQENFGLSVIEAVAAGCWPVLPRRLSYPEVMPDWVGRTCFADTESDMEKMLEIYLKIPIRRRKKLTVPLSRWVRRYSWTNRSRELDRLVEEAAASG